MADVQEPQHSAQPDSSSSDDLSKLKRELEGYRELILPLNKVLEWEQNHYPAILVGVITLIFAIVWYIEPSVLTSVSLVGVLLCLMDFVVPALSSYLFKSEEWTVVQERQFEGICKRIINAKTHCKDLKKAATQLKNEKPKVYLLVMMGAFLMLAWIGSLIDNLLLTYLLVVFIVLVPGLRKHGILQKATDSIMQLAKSVLQKGKDKPAPKSKTN